MKMNLILLIFCFVFNLSASGNSMQMEETPLQLPQINNENHLVFIAGYDEGDNRYYESAAAYFRSSGYQVVDSLYSLSAILTWLNNGPESKVFDEIHIVSHSNPWRGLSLKITPEGERITEDVLRSARTGGTLPPLQKGVSAKTQVIFHACGLGENKALLGELKTTFTVDEPPILFASPWYSIFGLGPGAHHLAKVYYTQYPTAYSPGPYALSKQLEDAYPAVDINWRKAMATRRASYRGDPYFYRFNIPVEWRFDFPNESVVPQLENREAIMDWVVEQDEIIRVLYTFNIPLERFRWRVRTDGRQLTILAKTTVVCIMEPIMQADDPTEFAKPDITNPALFAKI